MKKPTVTRSKTAKSITAIVTAATVVAVAAGCSSENDTADAPTAEGFPVTVDHRFGSTVIDAEPTRVVTVGYNEQDFVLALGVQPVATRGYLGYEYKQRPWAQDALAGNELPEVGDTELNLEQIAAQDPDLILGPYSFMEEEQYRQLSALAPTVADLGGYDDVPEATWQEEFAAIGAALGKESEAADQTAALEAKFETAAENPDFAGKTLAVAFRMEDGSYLVLTSDDIRQTFFENFGFVAPETTGEISPEQLGALDQDVLVIAGASREDLMSNPLFAGLDVVTEDRTVYLGPFGTDLPAALGFSSPLSLDYAIDEFTPMLAAAADGDPATVVPAPAG